MSVNAFVFIFFAGSFLILISYIAGLILRLIDIYRYIDGDIYKCVNELIHIFRLVGSVCISFCGVTAALIARGIISFEGGIGLWLSFVM